MVLKIKREYDRLEKEDSRLPEHIKENGFALWPFDNEYRIHHRDGCGICLSGSGFPDSVITAFVLATLIRNIKEIA